MKQSLLKLFVTAFVATTTAVGAMAQIPHDYYQSLKGKKGAELKTAIHNLVKQGRRIKLNFPSTAYLSSPHSIPLSVVLD